MANIHYVVNGTDYTCWSSTDRMTTPSLILVDGDTTRYTPLYSGNSGDYNDIGNYRYTLGPLVVANKRPVIGVHQIWCTNTGKIKLSTSRWRDTYYNYNRYGQITSVHHYVYHTRVTANSRSYTQNNGTTFKQFEVNGVYFNTDQIVWESSSTSNYPGGTLRVRAGWTGTDGTVYWAGYQDFSIGNNTSYDFSRNTWCG